MKSKFEVRCSNIDNKGVFSSQNIKKGEVICFLEEREYNISQMKQKFISGEIRLNDPLQVTEKAYMCVDKPYIYFNHSCNPNAGIKGKNELFAIKDIGEGEEITFDYSTTSWEKSWELPIIGEFSMTCKCGANNCRKIIKDFPYLDSDLKNKYLKLKALPDFIIQKFKFNVYIVLAFLLLLIFL